MRLFSLRREGGLHCRLKLVVALTTIVPIDRLATVITTTYIAATRYSKLQKYCSALRIAPCCISNAMEYSPPDANRLLA